MYLWNLYIRKRASQGLLKFVMDAKLLIISYVVVNGQASSHNL